MITGKRSNSAKVFNALSRRWSSNSLQFATDAVEFLGPNEPCQPGAHCITLKKLYAAEQRLQKDIKVKRKRKKIKYKNPTDINCCAKSQNICFVCLIIAIIFIGYGDLCPTEIDDSKKVKYCEKNYTIIL